MSMDDVIQRVEGLLETADDAEWYSVDEIATETGVNGLAVAIALDVLMSREVIERELFEDKWVYHFVEPHPQQVLSGNEVTEPIPVFPDGNED